MFSEVMQCGGNVLEVGGFSFFGGNTLYPVCTRISRRSVGGVLSLGTRLVNLLLVAERTNALLNAWTTPSTTAGEPFPFFFSFFFRRRAFSFQFFVPVALFLICTNTLSSRIYRKQSKSKAQSVLYKSAKQARADQSATTQAGRQSWREQACRRAFVQLAAFSKRTKKSKYIRQNIYI